MSLGKKYVCFQCEVRFYDLNRPEPICPKCGADQRQNPNPDPQEALLSKYKKPASPPRRSKKPEPAPLEEIEDDTPDIDEVIPDEDVAVLDVIDDVVDVVEEE